MRTLLVLAAVLAIALAEGQFYVPRAYYTIDAAGHESIPVPLQRLRRSPHHNPVPAPAPTHRPPYGSGSWSDSSSGANAWSSSGSGSQGGFAPPPSGGYGAANPNLARVYGVSGTFGPGIGLGSNPGVSRMISSSAYSSIDSDGNGHYTTSVGEYP